MGLALAVVVVAFRALVVTSVRDATVPVGGSGGGMQMFNASGPGAAVMAAAASSGAIGPALARAAS